MLGTLTLDFLFNTRQLFTKTRESNGFDDLELNLIVSKDLKNPEIWAGILNLCARLSFETISFNAPILIQEHEAPQKTCRLFLDLSPLNNGTSQSISIKKTDNHQIHIQSNSAKSLGMVINCLAANPIKQRTPSAALPGNAISTLEPGETLTGEFKSGDVLSGCRINDRAIGEICLTARPVQLEKKQDAASFHPLDFSPLYKKNPAIPGRQELDAVWSIKSDLISYPTGLALCDAVCAMVMESTTIFLPLAVIHQDKSQHLSSPRHLLIEEKASDHFTESKGLTIRFPDPAGSVHISGTAQDFSTHLSPWIDLALNQGGPGFSRSQALRDQIARFSVPACGKLETTHPHKDPCSVVHKFFLTSEIDTIMAAVSSTNKGTGPILCEVWTSKPMDIRTRMKGKIEMALTAKGYQPDVKVFNAFKPGICRILDFDLSALQVKRPASIHIGYRPFDEEPNALELNHRWLHELFPVAEILAKGLGLPDDAVTISKDDTQEEIYRLRAFDENQTLVFQDRFSPFFHTFDYMTSNPDLGTVSPTCAGITIGSGEKILLDQSIPTDRDQFWYQFQTVFLPDLIDAMETQIQSESHGRLLAFFESIQVDVFIDESNYRLGFMDEQISPMEKLHEDIYFFLLKSFEQFALKHDLSESLKLGQILPRVYSNAGSKGPRAVIQAIPAKTPLVSSSSFESPPLPFDTLVLNTGNWILSGCIAALEEHHQINFHEIQNRTIFKDSELQTDKNRFSLILNRALNLPPEADDLAHVETIPGPVPEDLLLMSKTIVKHLSRLNQMPHIRVWEIAKSLQGRPIYAVEAYRVKGHLVSIPRLRLAKPTILFNARHHANEISSTNATLKFIEFIASPQGQAYLETANAVFIPLENVDGVATFENLYVKNNCDILHAARYNALGAEFYDQYFKHPPVFLEALAKQRLWHRWLPELMADLHGVPNHEWCQPYAGYLPKGFREFWIPRAFVYVHLPFIEDTAHPLYGTAVELAGALRTAMAGSQEIVAANKQITGLYQKYARIPEPHIFPPADSTELTALPLLGRARNFNFAVQYPEITRSEVIVEVPDEVAHGENLALCTKAHFTMQKALMQALKTDRISGVQNPGPGKFEYCVSQASCL